MSQNFKTSSGVSREPAGGVDRRCPVEFPAFDPNFKANPFPFYEALLESGRPVSFIHVSTGVEAWLVTGYEEARSLLNDPRLSKDSNYAGANWHAAHPAAKNGTSSPVFRHLLTVDPPEHTRLRAMVSKLFLPRQIEMLRPRIETVTAELLDAIAPRGHADLIEEFARPLPLWVICELMGIPVRDQPLFRRWSELLVAAKLEEQHLIPKAAAELEEYLLHLAAVKRERPDESPYCELVLARDRGELSDAELSALGFLLLVAGHETTVNLIGSGVLAMLSQREEWNKLCANKALINGAVEEMLRFGSPVEIATPRFARCGIVVGDAEILPGDAVFIALAAPNRDPARFECPSRLDIERETAAHHLAFGYGIHYCVGAPLARLEGIIAFDALVTRFPDMALAQDPAGLSQHLGLLIRGVRELPVTFRPRPSRHA